MELETILLIVGITIGVILLLLFLIGIFIAEFVSKRNLNVAVLLGNKEETDTDRYLNEGIRNLQAMVDEEYEIISTRGSKLKGYLIKSKVNSKVYVFCIHGYRHPQGGFEFGRHSEMYLARGYNVFVIDHEAHHNSEGKYMSFGQYESLDCLKWLKFMVEKFGDDIEIILQGQSMGGATSILLAAKEDLPSNVKILVADCGYTAFDKQLVACAPMPKFFSRLFCVFVKFYLKVFKKIDLNKTYAINAIQNVKIPTLIVHGEEDTFVPLYMGKELYEKCVAEHKELLIVKGAHHAQSIVFGKEEYTKKVYEYCEQFLSE